MTTQSTTARDLPADDGTGATLAPDTLERLQRRVGIPLTMNERPMFSYANEDNIRIYANAAGMDNPLFTEHDYGKTTRWGSVIGSPTYPQLIANPYPVEISDEQRQAMKGGDPLRGISAYFSGVEYEFWTPVVPGDRVNVLRAMTAALEKHSEYAGRTILTWNGSIFVKDDGAPVMTRNFVFVHAERKTAREKGKYSNIQQAEYDDATRAEIDAGYAAEETRGATPRAWDEVNVGDSLGTMVRGPLLVCDIISWHMAHGAGLYRAIVSTKLAYKNRQRIPKFYTLNESGWWDSAQRCHWEDTWARKVGQPFAYDYGAMRDEWAITYITNWMGDNAWLWKYRSTIRKFNFMGDVHWFRGSVVEKYEADGHQVAGVELEGTNQRGETTIRVRAEVILPKTASDTVCLPDPPGGARSNPMEVLQALIRR